MPIPASVRREARVVVGNLKGNIGIAFDVTQNPIHLRSPFIRMKNERCIIHRIVVVRLDSSSLSSIQYTYRKYNYCVQHWLPFRCQRNESCVETKKTFNTENHKITFSKIFFFSFSSSLRDNDFER